MPPIAEVGGRTAGSLAAQAVVLELLPPWRQRLDSGASGTDLQVESERTAYAHECAQRAGVTTQRRHEAAPALSSHPRQFSFQPMLPKKRSVRGGPKSCLSNHPAARRKASSVHVHVTAARPQPAAPSPFARNRGMSPLSVDGDLAAAFRGRH